MGLPHPTPHDRLLYKDTHYQQKNQASARRRDLIYTIITFCKLIAVNVSGPESPNFRFPSISSL